VTEVSVVCVELTFREDGVGDIWDDKVTSDTSPDRIQSRDNHNTTLASQGCGSRYYGPLRLCAYCCPVMSVMYMASVKLP
jgi:hypothetical protein